MYSFFVGIDISKDFFDVAIKENQEVKYLSNFPNNEKGFKKLLNQLKEIAKCLEKKWFICFENTGPYSKPLLEFLLKKNISCREENSFLISRSKGFKRGKDDKIDAKSICMYAFRHRDSIKPSKLDDPAIQKLKTLLSRRALLVKQRASLKASVKEQKRALDKNLFKILKKQNLELIAGLTKQIKHLEALIEETINADPQMKKNRDLIKSVKGIGVLISAVIIAITHNFQKFINARQFACYSGIAPFPNRSGTSWKGKTKVSHIANKYIKSLLSNAARSAIVHDKELKRYYERKRAEGKEYGTVINAVKNKLVHRVFAVFNRQTPYVNMMSYA